MSDATAPNRGSLADLAARIEKVESSLAVEADPRFRDRVRDCEAFNAELAVRIEKLEARLTPTIIERLSSVLNRDLMDDLLIWVQKLEQGSRTPSAVTGGGPTGSQSVGKPDTVVAGDAASPAPPASDEALEFLIDEVWDDAVRHGVDPARAVLAALRARGSVIR